MTGDTKKKRAPIALTIAGSDSGGGAGIQADLKAFSALGVYGASVITAITAQNTQAVTAVHQVPTDVIAAQLDAVLGDLKVDVVKIGMLSSPQIIEVVAAALRPLDVPIVLDPVMVAKSGDRLLQPEALNALKAELLPICTVLTPNLPEAADLLGVSEAVAEKEILEQGFELTKLTNGAVLMKGGHADTDVCIDYLVKGDKMLASMSAARQKTRNTHGTGCTLSASIAAFLARGEELEEAAKSAHTYLHGAILNADQLAISRSPETGHGPVHHFWKIWQ